VPVRTLLEESMSFRFSPTCPPSSPASSATTATPSNRCQRCLTFSASLTLRALRHLCSKLCVRAPWSTASLKRWALRHWRFGQTRQSVCPLQAFSAYFIIRPESCRVEHLLPLIANTRLGWKVLLVENTPAYFVGVSEDDGKSLKHWLQVPEVVGESGHLLIHFYSDVAYNMTGFNITFR